MCKCQDIIEMLGLKRYFPKLSTTITKVTQMTHIPDRNIVDWVGVLPQKSSFPWKQPLVKNICPDTGLEILPPVDFNFKRHTVLALASKEQHPKNPYLKKCYGNFTGDSEIQNEHGIMEKTIPISEFQFNGSQKIQYFYKFKAPCWIDIREYKNNVFCKDYLSIVEINELLEKECIN